MPFLLAAISVLRDDEFEWDDGKARTNRLKHSIAFQAARCVFDDPFAVLSEDDSKVDGEDRYQATGAVAGFVITVSYTMRGERIRIISARKANSHEQRDYRRAAEED